MEKGVIVEVDVLNSDKNENVIEKELEIRTWNLEDHTLMYSEVLEVFIKKFNIQSITRAKIAFSSLKELEEFPVPISTSVIYLFDKVVLNEIDLSKIKVSGGTTIICSTSVELLDKYKEFTDEFFFSSVINSGEYLLKRINKNMETREFNFYHSKGINASSEQDGVTLKVPATLIW